MKTFGLSKSERIKEKKQFNLVYTSGKTVLSKNSLIKLTYRFDEQSEFFDVKAAFAVSKRAGNAVWRNRVKRLLRESFRLNKIDLLKHCEKNNLSLLMVFSPYSINQKKNKKIFLREIMPEVEDLMQQLINEA